MKNWSTGELWASLHQWIKLRHARAEMESTALSCLKALLSTGTPLLEKGNTMNSSALCSLCASHYSHQSQLMILSTVSELAPCARLFFHLLQLHPSWRESKPICHLPPPCLGWRGHLPAAGTAVPAGPAAQSRVCQGSDAEVELRPWRRLSSCGARFALWCISYQAEALILCW